MAALRVLSEQPTRLTLGKGGGNAVGTLIGLVVFGIVVCGALGSLLDEGGQFNPVMIVIALVIGIALLGNLANVLTSTRVVLDSTTKSAVRTESILLIPTRRQEMAFNLIRDVRVSQPRANSAGGLDAYPIWRVELQGADGTSLLVNERGTRSEMNALAERVGTLLNRPVRATNEANAPATAPSSAPAGVVGSLYENLVAFAQSAAEAGSAPTISAFPATSPRLNQERGERRKQRERYRESLARQPEPNTLVSTPSAVDSEAQLLEQSVNLGMSGVTGETFSAFSAAPVVYTAPPVLVFPEMPGMLSFAPAMTMPSFAPIGSSSESQLTPVPEPEIKEVQIQVAPKSTDRGGDSDALALARTARQLYAARNLKEAEATWLRALNANPADAAMQNDLGVVYLEENKLADAERAFRRAMALDPLGSVSRYNLGVALKRMGNMKQANEQFQIGLRNADRELQPIFREAQRGNLRAPLLSS